MSIRVMESGELIPKIGSEGRPFEKSKTRQSEAKYADINLIMAKYEKGGSLPPVSAAGIYADVSAVGDFREAIDRVQKGDELFMGLSAGVRKEFDNDVGTFLDFVSDIDNRDANITKLRELGVVVPEAAEPPVDPVPDPAPDPSP